MVEVPDFPGMEDFPPEYQPQWSRSVRLIAGVFLIIAAIYALTLLSPVIQMLALAFIIAFLMYAPAKLLRRYTRIPWAGSVLIVYLLLFVFVILIILIMLPTMVDSINNLVDSGQSAYERFEVALENYKPQDGMFRILGTNIDLNPFILPLKDIVLVTENEEGTVDDSVESDFAEAPIAFDIQQLLSGFVNIAGSITGFITSAIGSIAGLISTLLLSLFISLLVLLDIPSDRVAMLQSVHTIHHREMILLLRRIETIWNGFFRGQVFIGIVIGVITWVQLMILGIPNALLLAIITGLISLIPSIGGFIALVPLTLIPLIQGSTVLVDTPNWQIAILVVVINLIITQVIWNVIAPKILGDILNLPLPVIIVGVFIGAALAGVMGAFLVAPVLGTLKVFVSYLIAKIVGQDPFPGEDVPELQGAT